VFTSDRLNDIYDRTAGRCHICGRGTVFRNYGLVGAAGAWEVEHSRPRALGGTNRLNNLYCAHVGCNRAKGVRSTRAVRARYGRTRAPLSVTRRQTLAAENTFLAGALGAIVGARLGGSNGAVFGALLGMCLAEPHTADQ
jgi:5-methylcytosine-specific restriction endonuclease McrA